MKTKSESAITVALHWPRYGPYHSARLHAAYTRLNPLGFNVVGLETTESDDIYSWRKESATTAFKRFVAIPSETYEHVGLWRVWYRVSIALNKINPHAVLISGYSTPDAWSALSWCRLRRRVAILMSDSKQDDMHRVVWKENLKRTLIHQFDGALCAGKPHRAYLELLGMKSDKIFEGYDAVDNDFFSRGAEKAKRNPTAYRSLPGLGVDTPYFLASARFIKEKNLQGLLNAYGRYRKRACENEKTQTPWRLVLLGDGVERGKLEHFVNYHNISGVTFSGFRQIEELPIYYGLGRVFLHSARKDTWGLVVNEAMASGLPVLVSNRCGCVADLVVEGENGYTFSPDNPTELAELMLRMSSSDVDLETMGESSRRRIRYWGLERFAGALEDALRVAMQRRHFT